jgi:hypothetical protein
LEKSVDVKWGERKKIRRPPGKKISSLYLLIGKKVWGKKRLLEDRYLVMELDDLIVD